MAAPVMVRNTEPGPTVFALDADNHVEWAGQGDPMGGDLQPVPPNYLDHPQFQRAVTRGIFVVEDAPEEVRDALDRHKRDWDQRQQQRRDASTAALDQAPQNDVLMLSCIAPSGKGPGQLCAQDVPVPQRSRNETPPLCPMHKSLASQFIAEEGEKIVEGKPEVKWVTTRLGERTRQN